MRGEDALNTFKTSDWKLLEATMREMKVQFIEKLIDVVVHPLTICTYMILLSLIRCLVQTIMKIDTKKMMLIKKINNCFVSSYSVIFTLKVLN